MFFIRNTKTKEVRQVTRGHDSDEFSSGYCYRTDFKLFDSDEWEEVTVAMKARKLRKKTYSGKWKG